MLGGRAQLAVLDIHDLAIARERGRDLVGVMAIVQRPLAAVLTTGEVRTPRDLEGRKVGVTGLPSDDAVLRSIVEGAGAIRDAMSVLDDPSFSLTWEPLGADVGTSGDLGYTWGRYRRSVTREDGENTVAEGKYLTVWKRDRNGVWKVAADIGNSGAHEPPPAAAD